MVQRNVVKVILFVLVCNASYASKSTVLIDDLPPPYNSIELLPFKSGGHFGKRQAKGLQHLIITYKPKIVVEIGSYLGASTRYIAKLLSEDGLIYAVDHWLGSEEWFDRPNYQEEQKLFYQQFLSNVIHKHLCHKIIPMKMNSLEAAATITCIPDLAFIDGSHDYESVYQDICAWYPHVQGHGVLCVDDYNWGKTKSVKKAVDRFAKENNLTVKLIESWFWYYEKK